MKSSNLLNDMINFNETFRRNLNCGNVASHTKSELYSLSRKHNFENTIATTKLTPSNLSRACSN